MNFLPEQLLISFRGFTDEGFVLQVLQNGQPLIENELNTLEIMIEVSRYERAG